MPPPTIIALLFLSYVFAGFFFFMGTDGLRDDHEYVWWPVTLLKFLLCTLWEALTTGWRT